MQGKKGKGTACVLYFIQLWNQFSFEGKYYTVVLHYSECCPITFLEFKKSFKYLNFVASPSYI